VPLADARRIDLGVVSEAPVTVAGDADALHTLLRNLIDNAVRYTREGGRVDVAVEPATAAAGPKLVVSDDGPGIAADERARVFDRFYRRAGNPVPGSGLGLAIVKSVADAHHAGVALTDNPQGPGLRVVVSFPAGPRG
jgi:signal transduction histidine kinase